MLDYLKKIRFYPIVASFDLQVGKVKCNHFFLDALASLQVVSKVARKSHVFRFSVITIITVSSVCSVKLCQLI